MYVPTAIAHQAQFEVTVAQAAQLLPSYVLSVTPTLGSDWSGEPAVFFMVILSDTASRRDQLFKVTNEVSNAIVRQVQPLERWGVLPYFNFRSHTEQATIDRKSVA